MLPGNTVHEPYDYAVIIRQVINSQRRLYLINPMNLRNAWA